MPIAGEAGQIGRRMKPAFGDDEAIARDQGRQPLADCQRRFECTQIAVVDADEPRFQTQRAFELIFLVNFNENVHAIGKRGIFDLGCGDVVDRRHDDQDAIGPQRARFHDLVGLVDEILAQHRQGGRRARLRQELGPALERGRVGEHRQTGGAARLIGFGERRRIEIGADKPLRGAGLFDLGDQRIIAAGDRALDGA